MDPQPKNSTVLVNEMLRVVLLLPILVGPLIAAVAILGLQAFGLVYHFSDYAEAPPTVSRLLLYSEVEAPFGQAMMASALFLCVAVFQASIVIAQYIRLTGRQAGRLRWLLVAVVLLEFIAIAGMIVLSQFTGRFHPGLHDVGSYMLFFGHAFGISIAGLMIRSIVFELKERASALATFPRRALWVGGLSVLYGVVYFGGKFLPDSYFFWQRLTVSLLEIVVILSFLSFLFRFRSLLAAKQP